MYNTYETKVMEKDTEEFLLSDERYQPKGLDILTRTTNFTKEEIRFIYRGFKQECPTGIVDEESFKYIFSQFFPHGDARQYAHYVFNTIRRNDKGKVNFEDFLGILSKVSRGTVEEKLQWIFALYDLNRDGYITKQEMTSVVSSIYEMLGESSQPQVNKTTPADHVEKIFNNIDTNSDGVVTSEDLVKWCLRDETFLLSMENLDTIL